MMLDIAARRADFRALHKEGYFLLPTAWDVGGTKQLDALGFAALASSNRCLARTLGRVDGHVTRDEMLAHLQMLVDATDMAVNADFDSGFASDARDLTANVRLVIDTGIAALSIRDRRGIELCDLQQAIARIRVCKDAIVRSGADVLLAASSEGLLIGRASVDDTIKRLVAYSKAGADVLCAPGLSEPAAIRAVVEAVAPRPIDIQLTKPGITAAELGQLGVRRLSVGDSFATASGMSFERAAQRFIDYGDLWQ